jgi:hypothetical protein
MREAELTYAMQCVEDARSCSIIGLSNVGKSWLLRSLCSNKLQSRYLSVPAETFVFVYIDCNLMLELSEQGFYEAVLRATRDVLAQDSVDEALLARVETHYRGVIESSHSFRVPLNFNEAIISLGESLQRRLVFLFDEFDAPFTTLDSRVFLNLRALKDRYETGLCYITATEQPLNRMRSDTAVSEFSELFVGHNYWLTMLNAADASHLVEAQARAEGVTLEQDQLTFILEQAGGHPGLLQAAAHVLLRVEAGAPQRLRPQGLALARDILDSDSIVHSECIKLWQQLDEGEQEAMMRLVTLGPQEVSRRQLRSLLQKGILEVASRKTLAAQRSLGAPRGGDKLQYQGQTVSLGALGIFGQLFTRFTRRQRLIREGAAQGVLLDVDAGEVWVDGVQIPTLTDLEYRLLLLLYGRLDKICDKYQIVEAVWGESYIDQVDDARIEKLVSRLRSKVERDPGNPQYIITVRGRGYKLVSA